jgi:acetylornithine deacetylase
VTGRAAHSSRPDLGVSAIEAAAEVVGIVKALAADLVHERAHEDLLERPWVAVNVGRIEGGAAINIVPDRCVVQIGYRPLPGAPAREVFDRLVERIHERFAGNPARVDARILRITPSMLTPEGTPLQGILAAHASHDHLGAATFATDGGNLAKVGCAPLVFGPGSIEVAHQADEYVPIDQLHRAVDVIEAVIRTRCG